MCRTPSGGKLVKSSLGINSYLYPTSVEASASTISIITPAVSLPKTARLGEADNLYLLTHRFVVMLVLNALVRRSTTPESVPGSRGTAMRMTGLRAINSGSKRQRQEQAE